MKIETVISNIEKYINKIDYRNVYIEIKTKDDRYVLEKSKRRPIGFIKED